MRLEVYNTTNTFMLGYPNICGVSQCALGVAGVTASVAFDNYGRELRRAAEDKDAYFVIGVLDEPKPASQWATAIVQDPIVRLLISGEFAIDTNLQISSAVLFEFGEDPERA
jgi:hypothetical protein